MNREIVETPQLAKIFRVVANSRKPFCLARLIGSEEQIYVAFDARREVLTEGEETRFGTEFADHWFNADMYIMAVVKPSEIRLNYAASWAPQYVWEGKTSDDGVRVVKAPPKKKSWNRQDRQRVAPAPTVDEPDPVPSDEDPEVLKQRVLKEQEGLQPRCQQVPKDYAPDLKRDQKETFRIMQRGARHSLRDEQVGYGILKNLAREKREQGLHSLPDCYVEIRIRGVWVRCTKNPLEVSEETRSHAMA
ncbi:MAG: hypothetical protein V4664_01570 [Patescibacteria group bacterium]